MQTSISLLDKFHKDLSFKVDIDGESGLIDIIVRKSVTSDMIINLTRDEYLGLLDFLQEVAIEKLERPF